MPPIVNLFRLILVSAQSWGLFHYYIKFLAFYFVDYYTQWSKYCFDDTSWLCCLGTREQMYKKWCPRYHCNSTTFGKSIDIAWQVPINRLSKPDKLESVSEKVKRLGFTSYILSPNTLFLDSSALVRGFWRQWCWHVSPSLTNPHLRHPIHQAIAAAALRWRRRWRRRHTRMGRQRRVILILGYSVQFSRLQQPSSWKDCGWTQLYGFGNIRLGSHESLPSGGRQQVRLMLKE